MKRGPLNYDPIDTYNSIDAYDFNTHKKFRLVKKTKLNIDNLYIEKLPRDIVAFILIAFLNPQDIKNCYISHPSFKCLNDKQLHLVERATKHSFFSSICSNDFELFEYCFRINNISTIDNRAYRLDVLLVKTVLCSTCKYFDYIYSNVKIIPPSIISQILFTIYTNLSASIGPISSEKQWYYTCKLIELCKSKNYDYAQIFHKELWIYNKNINGITFMLKRLVQFDDITHLKQLKEKYNIDVEKKMFCLSQNPATRKYVETNGV